MLVFELAPHVPQETGLRIGMATGRQGTDTTKESAWATSEDTFQVPPQVFCLLFSNSGITFPLVSTRIVHAPWHVHRSSTIQSFTTGTGPYNRDIRVTKQILENSPLN